nr:CD209 antigen-like protein C [Misgurnus anguillicaudatus]
MIVRRCMGRSTGSRPLARQTPRARSGRRSSLYIACTVKRLDAHITSSLIPHTCNTPANPMNSPTPCNIPTTDIGQRIYHVLEFSASSCKLCEESWTSYSGKCYFFSSVNKTWFEAHDLCAASKAHLVTINSKAVRDFLVSKIKETHWIGLNDQKTEGRWVWLNDQTLEETGVQFWTDGTEPDNWNGDNPSGEDCACMGHGSNYLDSWFDASCKYKKKFICDKEFIAFQ